MQSINGNYAISALRKMVYEVSRARASKDCIIPSTSSFELQKNQVTEAKMSAINSNTRMCNEAYTKAFAIFNSTIFDYRDMISDPTLLQISSLESKQTELTSSTFDAKSFLQDVTFSDMPPSPVSRLSPSSDAIIDRDTTLMPIQSIKQVQSAHGHLTKEEQTSLNRMISNFKAGKEPEIRDFWLNTQLNYAAASSCFAQRAIFSLCVDHWQGKFDLGAFGGPGSLEILLRTLLLSEYDHLHENWLKDQDAAKHSSFIEAIVESVCSKLKDARASDDIVNVAMLQLKRASAEENSFTSNTVENSLDVKAVPLTPAKGIQKNVLNTKNAEKDSNSEAAFTRKSGLSMASILLAKLGSHIKSPWPLMAATRSLIHSTISISSLSKGKACVNVEELRSLLTSLMCMMDQASTNMAMMADSFNNGNADETNVVDLSSITSGADTEINSTIALLSALTDSLHSKESSNSDLKSYLLQTLVDACGAASILRERLRRARAAAKKYEIMIEELESSGGRGLTDESILNLSSMKQPSKNRILLRQNSLTAETSYQWLFEQYAKSDFMKENDLTNLIYCLRKKISHKNIYRQDALAVRLFNNSVKSSSDEYLNKQQLETVYALIMKELGSGDGEVTADIRNTVASVSSAAKTFDIDCLFKYVSLSQEFKTSNEAKQRLILGKTKEEIEDMPTIETSKLIATQLIDMWDMDGDRMLSLVEWMTGIREHEVTLMRMGKYGEQIQEGLQIAAGEIASASFKSGSSEAKSPSGTKSSENNQESLVTSSLQDISDSEARFWTIDVQDDKFSAKICKAALLIDSLATGSSFPNHVLFDLFSASVSASEEEHFESAHPYRIGEQRKAELTNQRQVAARINEAIELDNQLPQWTEVSPIKQGANNWLRFNPETKLPCKLGALHHSTNPFDTEFLELNYVSTSPDGLTTMAESQDLSVLKFARPATYHASVTTSWTFCCTADDSWMVGAVSDKDKIDAMNSSCIVNCNLDYKFPGMKSLADLRLHPEIHNKLLTAILDPRLGRFQVFIHNLDKSKKLLIASKDVKFSEANSSWRIALFVKGSCHCETKSWSTTSQPDVVFASSSRSGVETDTIRGTVSGKISDGVFESSSHPEVVPLDGYVQLEERLPTRWQVGSLPLQRFLTPDDDPDTSQVVQDIEPISAGCPVTVWKLQGDFACISPPSTSDKPKEEWIRVRRRDSENCIQKLLYPIGCEYEEPAATWSFVIDEPSPKLRFGLILKDKKESSQGNTFLFSYPPSPEDNAMFEICPPSSQHIMPKLKMRYCNTQSSATVMNIGPYGPYVCKGSELFPTFASEGISLTCGRWYYEFEWGPNAPKCPQVGWADTVCTLGDGSRHGVGDDVHSWGVDPQRVKAWNNVSKTYGEAGKQGDRFGCALDMDRKIITFYRNGISMGIAYKNFSHTGGLFPSLSFQGRTSSGSAKEIKLFLGGAGQIKYLPIGYQTVYDWTHYNANKMFGVNKIENGDNINLRSICETKPGDTLVFRFYRQKDTLEIYRVEGTLPKRRRESSSSESKGGGEDLSESKTSISQVSEALSIGASVVLASGYERVLDAKNGPLEPGDVGEIEAIEGSSKRLKVKFKGKSWWYDDGALCCTGSSKSADAGKGSFYVSGAGTGIYNGLYKKVGMKNNRPKYRRFDHDTASCNYSGNCWYLCENFSGAAYKIRADDGDRPPLSSTWEKSSGDLPCPVVSYPPTPIVESKACNIPTCRIIFHGVAKDGYTKLIPCVGFASMKKHEDSECDPSARGESKGKTLKTMSESLRQTGVVRLGRSFGIVQNSMHISDDGLSLCLHGSNSDASGEAQSACFVSSAVLYAGSHYFELEVEQSSEAALNLELGLRNCRCAVDGEYAELSISLSGKQLSASYPVGVYFTINRSGVPSVALSVWQNGTKIGVTKSRKLDESFVSVSPFMRLETRGSCKVITKRSVSPQPHARWYVCTGNRFQPLYLQTNTVSDSIESRLEGSYSVSPLYEGAWFLAHPAKESVLRYDSLVQPILHTENTLPVFICTQANYGPPLAAPRRLGPPTFFQMILPDEARAKDSNIVKLNSIGGVIFEPSDIGCSVISRPFVDSGIHTLTYFIQENSGATSSSLYIGIAGRKWATVDAKDKTQSQWKCIDSAGVAYRNTPSMDDRYSTIRGPEYEATFLVLEERVGDDGNWLKVNVDGHGTKYLPITKSEIKLFKPLGRIMNERYRDFWMLKSDGTVYENGNRRHHSGSLPFETGAFVSIKLNLDEGIMDIFVSHPNVNHGRISSKVHFTGINSSVTPCLYASGGDQKVVHLCSPTFVSGALMSYESSRDMVKHQHGEERLFRCVVDGVAWRNYPKMEARVSQDLGVLQNEIVRAIKTNAGAGGDDSWLLCHAPSLGVKYLPMRMVDPSTPISDQECFFVEASPETVSSLALVKDSDSIHDVQLLDSQIIEFPYAKSIKIRLDEKSNLASSLARIEVFSIPRNSFKEPSHKEKKYAGSILMRSAETRKAVIEVPSGYAEVRIYSNVSRIDSISSNYISGTETKSSSLDSHKSNASSSQISNCWGWGIFAKPVYDKLALKRVFRERFQRWQHLTNEVWYSQADAQLVEHCNEVIQRNDLTNDAALELWGGGGVGGKPLNWWTGEQDPIMLTSGVHHLSNIGHTSLQSRWEESDFSPTQQQLECKPDLAVFCQKRMDAGRIAPVCYRLELIRYFNLVVSELLPYIDFSNVRSSYSLAHRLSRCGPILFKCVKEPIWRQTLKATKGSLGDRSFKLVISRQKAQKLRAVSPWKLDSNIRLSCLSQAFRILHKSPTIKLSDLRSHCQLWNTVLSGERSHDVGGPYRELWEEFVVEVMSPCLPLLVPCPNQVNKHGMNRDRFVLNPISKSVQEIELFAFFGKLLGISIRNKLSLRLSLAPLVWKALTNEQPTKVDLADIDGFTFTVLNGILSLSRDDFDRTSLYWTVKSSAGHMVPLCPGGTDKKVKWENRQEYVDSAIAYRLSESDLQTNAVRRGLSTIVPQHLLTVFTWRELEEMVCGTCEMDIDLLRSMTNYKSFSSSDETINYFWETVSSMDHVEQAAFLRFSWGRSRLPLSKADFGNEKFTITKLEHSKPDTRLPIAHTCFFTLDLPAYSSVDALRSKLMYAIFNCVSIDGDDTSEGMAAAARGWDETRIDDDMSDNPAQAWRSNSSGQ